MTTHRERMLRSGYLDCDGIAVELILREALHRKGNFFLSLVAVAAAVLVCVALSITHEASQRETRRVTRDLGFNLRIIPAETDMRQFWLTGFSDKTMPDSTIHRLADHTGISYNHLVATLQRRIRVEQQDVILTGLSAELFPPGKTKPPMLSLISPGTVHVGYEVAQRLGLRAGDSLKLVDRQFRVARCAPETGSLDDMRVIAGLEDVQGVLGLQGRISEIQAIDCLCQTAEKNPLATLRGQLATALPEAKLVLDRVKADQRAKQRQMTERLAPYSIALVLAVCAAWVGVLAVMNVRERTQEIGLLRAIGYGTRTIAALVLGRAVLIGIAGALLGYLLGSSIAVSFGPTIFPVTAGAIRSDVRLLGWALLAAPTFTAVASFLPAMIAVTRDPAATLRET